MEKPIKVENISSKPHQNISCQVRSNNNERRKIKVVKKAIGKDIIRSPTLRTINALTRILQHRT